MFAYELQRRLYASGSKVLSVAAHPGMSDTNLFKHVPRWVNSIFGGLIRGMMAQSALLLDQMADAEQFIKVLVDHCFLLRIS